MALRLRRFYSERPRAQRRFWSGWLSGNLRQDPVQSVEVVLQSLSDIILRNTDIDWLQGNVFFARAIPAPASVALMGLGGLAAMRRRRA